jgi:hypothetical protein
MEAYFDPRISSHEMAGIAPRLMKDATRFSARQTRQYLLKRGFKPEYVVPFYYRPFDLRWLYWEPETKLLDEKRAEYFPHVFSGNRFLFTTARTRKDLIEPAIPTSNLADINLMDSSASGTPESLRSDPVSEAIHGRSSAHNISEAAAQYLKRLDCNPAALFDHALAVTHSELFRFENAHAIRSNWPRIPLPANREALLASAALGREVTALLDPESPIPREAKRLKFIAPITAAEGTLDPDAGDLELTAGWGHAGKGGATMPARGKISLREMTSGEREALPEGAIGILGEQTCDVWLNERAYWRNIPLRVWEYSLGGYHVIKKWLSYRERELLNRSLTVEEARYVTEMARRIAAILLLSPALDANYRAAKQATSGLTKAAEV